MFGSGGIQYIDLTQRDKQKLKASSVNHLPNVCGVTKQHDQGLREEWFIWVMLPKR